ncbi:MAG TPA: hypothetical protein VGN72_03290 [Tepidisphaeraceae bacterium]|nr:hypothetical protein [Tepidisphaeraceae bacterium]
MIGANYPSDPSPEVDVLFDEMGMNFARLTGGGYGWAVEGHRR